MDHKFDTDTIATSKRTVSSVVNGSFARPSNVFEITVTIVISISNMVGFTNLTIALQSAPDRIVMAYIGFRILQNNQKLET